jgi:hypothetical protein
LKIFDNNGEISGSSAPMPMAYPPPRAYPARNLPEKVHSMDKGRIEYPKEPVRKPRDNSIYFEPGEKLRLA